MHSDEQIIARILRGNEVTNTQEKKALKRLDGMTTRATRVLALALFVKIKLNTRAKKKNEKKKNEKKKNEKKKNRKKNAHKSIS